MNESLAGLKIGSSRKKVTITDVNSKRFAPEDKNDRLYIDTISSDGATYKVSEVWIRNYKQEIISKGLWLNMDYTEKALDKTSLLSKLLQHIGATGITDMVGKEVYVEPKENGFMGIVVYED